MIIAYLSRYFYRQKARFFLTPLSYLPVKKSPEVNKNGGASSRGTSNFTCGLIFSARGRMIRALPIVKGGYRSIVRRFPRAIARLRDNAVLASTRAFYSAGRRRSGRD